MSLEKYKKIICGLDKNKLNGCPPDDPISFYSDNPPDDSNLCFLGSVVTYSRIGAIDAFDKYFYIIEVRNPNYFRHTFNPLGYIDPVVLKDVKIGLCKLIVNYCIEGNIGYTDHVMLEQWINELQLPPNNCYLISGNLLSPTFGVSYNICPITVWDNAFIDTPKPLKYKPLGKDLFLCLNRVPRTHRLLLLYHLHNSRLFDDGLISYTIGNNDFLDHKKFTKIGKQLLGTSRILDFSHGNLLAESVPITLYERSFVSVVTETLIEPEYLFITEKTWKTIYAGHPFMVLSSIGTLKELQRMGYQTFSKWFDESYDGEESLDRRCEIIVSNLNKFKSLSSSELIDIRHEMEEVTTFNQQLFQTIHTKKYKEGDVVYNRKPIADLLLSILKNW